MRFRFMKLNTATSYNIAHQSHNPAEQITHVTDRHKREREEAMNEDFPQVKKYIESNPANVNNAAAEHLRRQIFLLKDLKKNAEKHTNREDIRGFFK